MPYFRTTLLEKEELSTQLHVIFLCKKITFRDYIGGGINVWNHSFVTVTDSHFLNNSLYGSGGAIHISKHCILEMLNVTFDHNRVDEYCGAVYAAEFTTVFCWKTVPLVTIFARETCGALGGFFICQYFHLQQCL